MARTYWEHGRWTAAEAWRAIRQLRAIPPSLVTDERRPLFSAALEQSEQLFRAASVAGPESRPLTVFYGLSQAGRAIAAARAHGVDYQLRGHGLTADDLTGSTEQLTDFPNLTVRTQGRTETSFRRLSAVLGSPELPTGIALQDLWAMLPEAHLHHPLTEHPYPVLLSGYLSPDQPYYAEPSTAPATLTAATFATWAQRYPDLRTAELIPESLNTSGRFTWLRARLPSHPGSGWGTDYRGTRVHLPTPPGQDIAMHPILIWWAILLALSTLARYSPTAWATIVNVDVSPHAVPVDHLLEEALAAVPELIYRTLTEEPDLS